jgi:hypothetical protein
MKKLLSVSAAVVAVGVAATAAGASAQPGRASIVLHLRASAERAFPMFDPVNEKRWSPGWQPTLLGDARVAEGLVFTTEDEHGRAGWLLDRYDPRVREVRYVVARPATLMTIDITVVPDGPSSCIATVTYTRTALDAAAASTVDEFLRHFPLQAPHWESAINAALAS